VPWAVWRLAQRYAPRVARAASSGWPAVRFCALRVVGSVVYADGAGKREHAGVDMRGVVIGGDDVDVLLRGVPAGWGARRAKNRADPLGSVHSLVDACMACSTLSFLFLLSSLILSPSPEHGTMIHHKPLARGNS
jgi:hypothetical protein